ncbi:MAG: hypothetical protein R3B13_22160 [Polyangiaceae bacterium]
MARFAHLLFLGKLDADRRRSLTAMAQASKLDLANVETTPAALSWLEHNEPALVTFDTRVARADKLCEKVRSRTTLSGVPLIALTSDISDVFVEKLYSMGADDVIPAERNGSLLSRLKSLPLGAPGSSTNSRGRAVVCDKDRARGAVFARVLSNAGYDVKLALDDVALRFFSQQKDVRLIVAAAELGVDREMIDTSRRSGCDAVWVVTAPRMDITEVRERLEGLERTSVMGAYLPPESVLFSSNEMLSGADKAARQSPRMLYGTCVWFRGAGADDDELGLTYNISAGGLFVRTLLAPSEDEVWLELRPPRQKRRVRLSGRIAWRRGFDLASMAAAPPGFGVEVRGGLGDDHQQFLDGFHTLIETPRTSAPSITIPKNLPELVALSAPLGVAVRDAEDGPPGAAAGKPTPPRPGAPEPPRPEPTTPQKPAARVPDSAPAATTRSELDGSDGEAHQRQQEVEAVHAAAGEAAPAVEEVLRVEAAPALPEPIAARASADASPPPASVPGPGRAAWVPPADGNSASFALGDDEKPAGVPTSNWKGLVGWGLGIGSLLAAGFWGYEWLSARAADERASAAPQMASAAQMQNETATPSAGVAPGGDGAEPESSGDAAAPSASGAAAANASAPVADDGDDGSKLNWSQGYLVVESSRQADVYATGFKVGRTNAKNLSSCGLKYVRLGEGEPPSWVSEGQTVDVKCRAVTRVRIDGKP